MYTKTRIETMNSASMISDLFEIVNGFVKQRKTQRAGCQKKECCHDFKILLNPNCSTTSHICAPELNYGTSDCFSDSCAYF